jgi:DNA-binding MarR family transcriptional regulator
MLTEDPGVPAGDALQEERSRGPKATPWLLRRVSQRFGAVVAAQLEDAGLAGLPRPGYWLLMALASGSKDASQLVGAVGVSKQAISKVVDTLVLEGFVERRPNAEDRRRTDLVLTQKGARTVDVVRDGVRVAEQAFVDEVGAAPWATTVATLAALARNEA